MTRSAKMVGFEKSSLRFFFDFLVRFFWRTTNAIKTIFSGKLGLIGKFKKHKKKFDPIKGGWELNAPYLVPKHFTLNATFLDIETMH